MMRDDNPVKILDYYSVQDEQDRLSGTWGQVELVRSQILIRRFLPKAPSVIADVGGAAGRYACWLARKGYEVHLVDPVLLHIEQARAASNAQPQAPIASCRQGDARQLPMDDDFADGLLLMGPLYHLQEKTDRLLALSEAHRVLKPGGTLFAVAISRFASTIDGLASGYSRDPAFRAIMLGDLEDGRHHNPTRNPAYFTEAYFAHPQELRDEVNDAGFEGAELFAIEGLSYMAQDLDSDWADEERRIFLLGIIARTEREPTLIGASPHIMCVATKRPVAGPTALPSS